MISPTRKKQSRKKRSEFHDFMYDLSLLGNGAESVGIPVPFGKDAHRYRNAAMVFVRRNCTPPEGKKYSSVIKEGFVWVQLADTK